MPGKNEKASGKRGGGGGVKKGEKRKLSATGSLASSTKEDVVSFEVCHAEGNTFRSMGMYKKAINSYTKALDMKPTNKTCLLARSQCYQQVGCNDLALADANKMVAEDTKSIKGLLQKADVYYQMGEFEYSLMLYHRGNKIRPEIQAFRLGIQKSKEAIDNSVGENAGIELENKGDLSFFTEAQKPQVKRKDGANRPTHQTQQQQRQNRDKKARQPRTAKANEKDKKTVKQLLGELYDDMNYLKNLLHESEQTTKTKANEQVAELATECLDYLDHRAEFWQQQQPTYSREKERQDRRKGNDNEQKKKEETNMKNKLKSNPTKWFIKNLQSIDRDLEEENYAGCIDRSSKVLKELEKYSETEVSRKKEFKSDAHSTMGNAYIEMEEYEEAVKHHEVDLDISKERDSKQNQCRALENMARTYMKMGQHNAALQFFGERLEHDATALDKAWIYHEIGRCYFEQEKHEKAKENGKLSLESAQQADDQVWQLNASILVAHAELKLKDNEKSLEMFERSLELARRQNDSSAEKAIQKMISDIKNETKDEDETDLPSSPSGVDENRAEENTKEGTLTDYKISVTMGDVIDAGTDLDLYVELFGSDGSSTDRLNLIKSETNAKKHEKGQTDDFTITGVKDVGKVTRLRVGQAILKEDELAKVCCYISRVTIVQSTNARSSPYVFNCNKWFDETKEDGLTEREFNLEDSN